MKTLAKRIQYIKDVTGWTNADLARKAKVSRTAPTEWLKGKVSKLSAETAMEIDKNTGFSGLWVSTGEGQPFKDDSFKEENPLPDGYIRYNLLDVRAAAGSGYYNIDDVHTVRQIDVLQEWASRILGPSYKRCHMITATGTSMSPTIEDGDVLFIDPAAEFTCDGVYVIGIDGKTRVKRLQRLSGERLALISDNRLFQTEIFDAAHADEIVIFGRVLHALKNKKIY